MEHSAFPNDETLAAFIDGRLDEETRKRVVAHVADCEDCYGTVMAAGAWGASETDSAVAHVPSATVAHVPSAGHSLQYGVLGAVAATLAFFLVFRPVTTRYHEWHDQKELRNAANELPERPIDPRLSLDLEYRRKASSARDGSNENSGNGNLFQAFADIHDVNDARPTVSSRHSLGLAYLLLGKYDEGTDALTEAVKEQTSRPDIHAAIAHCGDVSLLNDLAAAFVAQASHTDAPSARALAREAAQRAVQIDPRSKIAAWNRAVAIESTGPKEAAVAAWDAYLDLDRNSAWGVEAIERRRRLLQD